MRIRAIAGLTGLLLFAGVLTAQPVGDSNDVLFATLPQPVSGQVVASTWTTLRWQPGHFAAMHRLYVSEDFNDVNEGTVAPVLTREAFQVVGSAGTPIPTGLASNTTYYWRVDEVNDVHPDSPWKGEVWSFAVAPLTAWGPTPADGAALPVEATNPLTWNAGLGAAFHYWYFSEKFEFAATHKLWNDAFSEQQNFEVFGKCANPAGHGHNYVVEVTVKTPGASEFPIGRFEEIVHHELIRLVDHKNLNVDVEEFGRTNPTVENIAVFAWERLNGKFAEAKLHCITVWETDKTCCSYYG